MIKKGKDYIILCYLSPTCKSFSRSVSDTRTSRRSKPSELQIKLSTLKKNIWTGVQSDIPNSYLPLSWGISNLAMSSYTIDSESLLK